MTSDRHPQTALAIRNRKYDVDAAEEVTGQEATVSQLDRTSKP